MADPVATAARIGWLDVPETVRVALEGALGSPVAGVESEAAGYSPSFAARCRLADGRRVFVKAVSPDQNPVSPAMLRHEIRVTRELPRAAPAPELRHAYDDGHWVAAVFDEVEGRPPRQPWDPAELAAVLAAIDGLAPVLDPCPVAELETLEEKFGAAFSGWRRLAGGPVPAGLDAWSAGRLDELATVEAEWVAATAGDALVHFDVRADNVLLGPAGEVWFVDWANAARGASWIDTLLMLPSVALQGGPDPATALATTSAAARVDAAAVTALVVALAGFFTYGATLPPPPGLPQLRAFQAAQGEVARAWARDRLG
jgi:aminoglycoside phosphotransferase (APT) family kinase protein